MPKFPKSTGFSMPMKEYGRGKSPFQGAITDTEIVAGQKELDEQELKFKEPGWATVAGSIHKGAMSAGGLLGGKEKTEGNGDGKSDAGAVSDIVKQRTEGTDLDDGGGLSGGEELPVNVG